MPCPSALRAVTFPPAPSPLQDLDDEFGPSDHLLFCRNGSTSASPTLVFVDLDIVGQLYSSADLGVTWRIQDIVAYPCSDPLQPPAPLVPKDGGYTVGRTQRNDSSMADRLLVIGGDQEESNNNVYYSCVYAMCGGGGGCLTRFIS